MKAAGAGSTYIAFPAIAFPWRAWVMPYFKRMAKEQERAKEELRHQLGREPTDDEVLAQRGITCGR